MCNPKCALCGLEKELQLSHIVPKFVGRYLKKSSAGAIRNLSNPNRTVQDIEKHYLLCHDCEELFSNAETYFANTIFYPYQKDEVKQFHYDEKAFYFIVSLSWRSLYLDICNFVRQGTIPVEVLQTMIDSEKIMRDYLLGSRHNIGNIENHIFFFERIQSISGEMDFKNPHTTVHRALQSYSGYADDTVFTVSNLLGIIIVSLYSKGTKENWTNTQIFETGGTIASGNQGMVSCIGAEIHYWTQQTSIAQDQMSEQTIQQIEEKFDKIGEDIKSYKIYQDIVDDSNL